MDAAVDAAVDAVDADTALAALKLSSLQLSCLRSSLGPVVRAEYDTYHGVEVPGAPWSAVAVPTEVPCALWSAGLRGDGGAAAEGQEGAEGGAEAWLNAVKLWLDGGGAGGRSRPTLPLAATAARARAPCSATTPLRPLGTRWLCCLICFTLSCRRRRSRRALRRTRGHDPLDDGCVPCCTRGIAIHQSGTGRQAAGGQQAGGNCLSRAAPKRPRGELPPSYRVAHRHR